MVWYRSWTHDLSGIGRRSWTERWLVLEALVGLLLAGALVRSIPFKRLSRWYGLRLGDGVAEIPAASTATACRVGWAVSAVARRTPGYSTCLVQALAGAAMLRRRGLPATVYLGMAKDEVEGYLAHAWLRCGDRILTGRHDGRFATVASFSSHQDPV
ncbi:MAG: lasso peptide biosynthesis B2 protein [Chloroflexi bacterium]|nr:lasso peptide biosynthesis B2 protein [Chloroflexota bacterium]